MNKLDQLKTMTTVVADTGDIQAIALYKPLDATTNPSLLLKASLLPHYQPLVTESIKFAQAQSNVSFEQKSLAGDKLATLIGKEILQII